MWLCGCVVVGVREQVCGVRCVVCCVVCGVRTVEGRHTECAGCVLDDVEVCLLGQHDQHVQYVWGGSHLPHVREVGPLLPPRQTQGPLAARNDELAQ